MAIKSPCVLVCALDSDSGLCRGCGRSAEEIGAWTSYSDEERDRIMAELPARMERLNTHGTRSS